MQPTYGVATCQLRTAGKECNLDDQVNPRALEVMWAVPLGPAPM